MKLTEQPNFEISGVVAENISISGLKMNGDLMARISFDGIWLVLVVALLLDDLIFSVILKSKQKQKHPLSIELETQCTGRIWILNTVP